jgi:Tol biopolymer transport system component
MKYVSASIVVVKPDGSSALTLDANAPFSWSPDGTRLAFVKDGQIVLGDVGSGKEHVVDTGSVVPIAASGVVWAPRGSRFLFFGSDGNIYVLSPEGGTPRRIGEGGYGSWSPDGRSISVVRGDCCEPPPNDSPPLASSTDVFDVASGRLLFTTKGSLSWSPTVRQVAITRSNGVFLSDRTGRHVIPLRPLPLHRFSAPAWAPDGSRLAVRSGASGAIRLFDHKGRQLRKFIGEGAAMSFELAWAPSARKLAFVCLRGGRSSTCIGDVATGRVGVLARGASPVRVP